MRTDDGVTAVPAVRAAPRLVLTLAATLRAQGALFAPLRFPEYRLAWTGRLVSLLGDHFQIVALAAVALALTGRAAGLGALLAVEAVPRALLMLVGGVATDRFRPRAILVGTSLVQGVLTAALAWLALHGDLALWHLYVYAGAIGTATAFFMPAAMAVVPEMLPPEQVRRGNALWSLAFSLARSVAPPVAGVAVALGGGATAFALNAVSFFVAAVAFARTRETPRAPRPRTAPLRQLAEGLRAARRDPVVWTCVLVSPVYTMGSMGATLVGLPTLAKLALGAGDQGVGVLFGAFGAGAVLGAFATDAVAARPRQGVVGSLLCVGVGACLALTGAAPTLWAAVPPLVLAGALQAAAVVVFFTLIQMRAPVAVRGRVLSLYTLGIFGLTPLSFALAGVGADVLGPRLVLVLGGALVALCGTLTVGVRAMRDLE